MEQMEQEISLREIIEIIWSGKWIILLITALAIGISGVYSFFILESTYEARVTLSINSANSENGPSLPQYIEQVESHAVMRATIQELGLDVGGVTINALRDRIRSEIIEGTNLIRIYVKDNDAERASEIANVVTGHFIKYIEKQKVEQIIASLSNTLTNIESDINIQRELLAKTLEKLSNTPQFIEVKKSLSQDPFLHSVVSNGTNTSSAEVGAIEYKEQVFNPVYNTLQQEVTGAQLLIQNYEIRQAEVQSKIDNRSVVVNEYILIASPAIPPEKPIAPKKALNVAIAGVIGAMVSLLIVIFISYWRSTSTNYDKSNHKVTISS